MDAGSDRFFRSGFSLDPQISVPASKLFPRSWSAFQLHAHSWRSGCSSSSRRKASIYSAWWKDLKNVLVIFWPFACGLRGGGRARSSALKRRAEVLRAWYSAEVIIRPSKWRIACSIGGRDLLLSVTLQLGSSRQSSIVQRTAWLYCGGRVAGLGAGPAKCPMGGADGAD